ncbi:response regulator [Frankia sp. Cr1]|uniref:response regulator n=1 Tax=Frankia sp. Cr1 TaxID=3073931 RepID=UPI002AD5217B|nr:response regulator [Frankia sp. Cr1]
MDTCFIAMPISTPGGLIEDYDNDGDHFAHVLDHLFIPAIENIGLKPISPLTVGSPVIHAEIIKQITDAQLLLCDMSTLNANVFFELGIRTALNLPVCLVQDTLTGSPPFDLNLVNHHRYNPSLTPWILKDEMPRLQKHLQATLAAGDHNAMWGIVGLTRRAEAPIDSADPVAARIELLENQVRVLANFAQEGVQNPRSTSNFLRPLLAKRILWVDDIPENNSYERSELERAGTFITIARSTAEAAEKLGREKFDLIISDVDRQEDGKRHRSAGFELLQMLREELRIYTPVIFYTGNPASAAKNPLAQKYRTPVAHSSKQLINLVSQELLGSGG